MNNKLVVVTDLGSFKAYKLEKNDFQSTPRLELIEEFNTIDGHGKLSDKLTDVAGRYKAPTSRKWSTPWGERHNIELENKRRLIKQLAQSLATLLSSAEVEGCYFAASREINHQILDELPPHLRAKIEKNVPADLTKADKLDVLTHFLGPLKKG